MNTLRNFRLQVVVRVIGITLSLWLFVYLVSDTTLYASITLLGIAITLQVWRLLWYIKSGNRQFLRFLEAIRHGDVSHHFSSSVQGSSFQELNTAFNDVVQQFQRIRAEKEEQYQAVQTLLHHVGIGLLAFDTTGEVDFINPAAKKLLHIPHLRFIYDLSAINTDLPARLRALQAGETTLIKIVLQDEIVQLVVAATRYRIAGREYCLISLQNIVSELEEQEMEAWQRLIRVLTHEIMNSIAPISSLSETIHGLLAQSTTLEQDHVADIRSAIITIHKRSQGLMRFVENYRHLTRVPKPDFQELSLNTLFRSLQQLFQQRCEAAAVQCIIEIQPASLTLYADEHLLEQVFINLIINALHALEGKTGGIIRLTGRLNERGRAVCTVEDNGVGIIASALEKIFVPFFTTKPEGSGIGLSLVKQIIRLHGGSITVQSEPDKGTIFILKF